MKKLLTFIGVLILLMAGACTKNPAPNSVQCNLEDGLEGTIAYGLQTLGNCDASVVRGIANQIVDSAHVCAVDSKKLKGIGICSIITAAFSSLAGMGTDAFNAKFPGANCNPAMLVSGASAIVGAACVAVFPVGVPSNK